MKNVHLIQLIVIGSIVSNLTHATCCKDHSVHVHSKKNAAIGDREKQDLVLLVPYDDNDPISNSNENAREKSSAEVQELANQLFPIKIKRDPDDGSKVILDYTDMLDSSKNEENTESPNKKNKPFYLMKKVENPKEVIKQLIQVRKIGKNKRNTRDQESIPIILGTNINKARNARSKKYKCLCREPDCQGKRCYEHAQHENVDNTSAEEVGDTNVGAYSEYTQQVIPTQPIPTMQPTKFNIPFANNVNFDQRVIVNNNEPDYSFYQKSTPYGIPLPKYIYNGPTPPQQNYAYAIPTKTSSEDYIPTILRQKFDTIEECNKLYGRRFCLIASTTKAPFETAKTIDLTQNEAVRTYSAEMHDSNVDTYYSAITENPVLSHENEVHSQIQPAYENEYHYQPMQDMTAEPILQKSVENIQRTTIHISDSATERLIDPQNAANIGIAKATYQTECPSAPKYLRSTTPKVILKEPITYRSLHTAVDSRIVNENEAAQRQYYEQTVQSQSNMEINDNHYTAGNSYVPNYSSKEMVQNKTYENMISQQQMYDYAAYQAQQAMQAANLQNSQLTDNQFGSVVQYYNNQNIQQQQQQQQQQQMSGSYTADTSISNPTYSLQEVMENRGYINNLKNMQPTYISTTGYPNQSGNNIQTENQATSQAPVYQPTTPIQYAQDRTQQTPPDSVASTKHVHNFSSKEVVKNESYEDKVESSKVANTYSNVNKNLPQTDQSAKDQNAKIVTDRSKNTANLDVTENAQKMQSIESHVASSKYSNNYSSKEVTDSQTYEANNEKQKEIDTQLSDNNNPELQSATTTTVASNNVKTPKSGARKTVQVIKYRRYQNPRLVRLTGSKIATRSSNANLDASKNSIILKNYNINNNNPAEGYADEYAENEFLSTPKSLYNSAENSDLITNRPLQVVQYHSNKNAQLVKLTGSNVETEISYGDINASNEHNNNYATINENIGPVSKYPNQNYHETADTTVKSVIQSVPLYNHVGNNNETPQLTKVSTSHFANDGNTMINSASKNSVNNADYENNVDYTKPSYSYITYTPIHETVESDNVQQLKLTESHYNDNTYIPNYSSKEFIKNSIENLNVPHVTESYQAVESDYAIHRPYNQHIPYNMEHVDHPNLNHYQSPTIYQENKNIQHILPYKSNNVVYSTNYHNSHVHAGDAPNSETLTGQQSDTAEYYHYSNAQQETYQQYPTTNSDYMNHPIPHQSLSYGGTQPVNVENSNSHSYKQRDANNYYHYTNTQQGNYQHYPTTNSPFYIHSSNYQNSQQTLTHTPNFKNLNIATYNEDHIPKYYEYTDGNNPNANPTGSYSARDYNSAHNNFQMTATPTPPYNHDSIRESIPEQSTNTVGYYANENIGSSYIPNYAKQNINSNNYPSYDYYNSQQNISPESAVQNTNLDNSNSASNTLVKILEYHESDAQSPRPVYVYIPENQNRSPKSSRYNSSFNNRKYYTTTVKIIDYDDAIDDQDSSHKISPNNYEIQSPTYNYIQNVPYNPSNIQKDDLPIHIDTSAYDLEHDISAMPKEYSQPIISTQNPIFRIPQVANLQKEINIQLPPTYQIKNTNVNSTNPTKNSDELQYVAETVTTLEDVEDEEYKKHFNQQRIAKIRAAGNKIQGQTETKNSKNERHLSIKDSSLQFKKHESNAQVINQSSNTRINKIAQVSPTPQGAQDRAAYNEALFKGLEKIILQNDAVSDSLEHSYVGSDKSSESAAQKQKSINKGTGVPRTEHGAEHIPQKSYGTETAIQSVDERPSVISEQDFDEADQYINEAVLQSVVKKVINNLVPRKAQDLMTNYGTAKASEIVGAGIEDLLPEIINNPALKNLFSLPEVENMIIDRTSRLLTSLTGLPIIGQIPQLMRNALHGVVDQIPRPHPTVAPWTVEEHKFKDGEWVTERVSLLGSASKVTENPPREVLDKIKSIINRSALEEQSASQPVVENLIIKTVKYLLDEERGIIDESIIRKAFNLVVHQSEQAPSTSTTVTREVTEAMETTKPITSQSETTTPMDDKHYKIAPIIPVTEHAIRNGQWYEAQKNLVGKKQNQNVGINEDKRKNLQEKLDILNKAKSEEQSVAYNTQQVHEYNSKEFTEETLDQSIERKPTKYYSPNDRILVYIKHHKSTEEPSTTMGEIIGRTNHYDIDTTTHPTGAQYPTSTKYNMPIVPENPANTLYHQQSEIIENNRNVNEYVTSVHNHEPLPENPVPPNQLKMLVDPSNRVLKSESQTQRNINNHMEDRPETVKQLSNHLNLGQTLHLPGSTITQVIHQNEYPVGAPPSSEPQDVTYLGRLVPMNQRATQAKDLSDLRDSNLVYVGDGVRLPLTIRRMQDGSFALTLSDEVCKRFIYKQCPCCLPTGPDGVIVRERKNRDVLLPQMNSNDDNSSVTSQDSKDAVEDTNMTRDRRDSSENRPTITASPNVPEDMHTNQLPEKNKEKSLIDTLKGLLRNAFSLDKQNDSDEEKTNDTNDTKPQYKKTKIVDESRTKVEKKESKIRDEKETVDGEEKPAIADGKFTYQNNPITKTLKQIIQRQDIDEVSGSSDRYQRHTGRYMTSNDVAEKFKNVLHWMKEFVDNKPPSD